jgi:hypothetical protein
MRYPLVHRVRGIFLGTLLGENLALRQINQSHSVCDLGKVAVIGSQSLINLGKLDVDDWLERQQAASLQFDQKDTSTAWGKIILSTLPIVIFYHENNLKLRDNLGEILQAWEVHPVIRDATLAVGLAIAQSLTERLDPITIIPQIITFLGDTSTALPEELAKLNVLLQHKSIPGKKPVSPTSSIELSDRITPNITLLFYYFLNTLEDFRLSVWRAASHHSLDKEEHIYLPEIYPARGGITGALSGAYNSIIGIPTNLQVLFSPINLPAWGFGEFSQVLKLSDALLAVWSGVYNLNPDDHVLTDEQTTIFCNLAPFSIFAAPRVIRPR